jgi:hypothetical protein
MPDSEQDIQAYVERAITEWKLMAAGPPWDRLEESERVDFLAPLVNAVLRCTLREVPDPQARAESIRAAATHGKHRREQGFTEDEILHEHYFVRLAIWSASRATASFPLRARGMARADVLFSALVLATLRGFHGESADPDGRWPNALADLLGQ